MKNLTAHKHEDKRRTLIEYISDTPIRMSKVLYIKEDSVLGNHYHKLKDDIFYLLQGNGVAVIDGKVFPFSTGDCLLVEKGEWHTFYLKRDSILLESSTLPYDKGDEYEV